MEVCDMDDARTAVLMAEFEDAKRKRDRLNIYIEALAERLGISVDDQQSPLEQQPAPTVQTGQLTDDVLSLVHDHELHGMKMPKAAEAVLRRWSPEPYRRPLKTKTLMEALQKGGLKIAEPRVLYRSLYTAPRIARLEGGLWGLAEWYGQNQRKPASPKADASLNGGTTPDSGGDQDVLVDAGNQDHSTSEEVQTP
jgi:hypothetical protein